MKESVTKFDFESAFKALDEIEIPTAEKGIKANRPALTEIFSRKSKFDALFEEYYDVSNTEELGEAQEVRDAEIAKAKLARIEKIVDLDAESPDDLLTSYVGKFIIQCPQCMTLFYKNPEDVVESEEDPTTVNVSEVCQHCGNESGYTLVGKVGEAEPEETMETTDAEISMDDLVEEEPAEEASEETSEEPTEETMEETDDINLDELNLNIDEDEEVEESHFVAHTGEALVEELSDDEDLDAKLKAHSEYIEYLRDAIAQEEEKLEKADNEQVKTAIQRNIDAFKADLESALPEAVKEPEIEAEPIEDETTEEVVEDEAANIEVENVEETEMTEVQEESLKTTGEALTESLLEDADLDVSEAEFEELINSPEFKQPISDEAVEAMLDSNKEKEEPVEEKLEEGIFGFKTRIDKADFVLKNAIIDENKAQFDKKGLLIDNPDNRRFNTFLVIAYTDTYKTGKKITGIPKPGDVNLVPNGKPRAGESFKAADSTALGLSNQNGMGPVAIYLAKNEKGEGLTFVCQYVKGKLYNDNVENYFNKISSELDGAKKIADGNMRTVEDDNEVTVSALEAGKKIKIGDKTWQVAKAEASTNFEGFITISLTGDGGATDTLTLPGNTTVMMVEELDTATGLSAIMEQLEDIHEESLEKFITESLTKSYSNVAGYKISSCDYLNEKLSVSGTIYFNSGNTRNTTYTFSEAVINNENVTLTGLNEKLGVDKKFTITGKIDTTTKTLITESFSKNN